MPSWCWIVTLAVVGKTRCCGCNSKALSMMIYPSKQQYHTPKMTLVILSARRSVGHYILPKAYATVLTSNHISWQTSPDLPNQLRINSEDALYLTYTAQPNLYGPLIDSNLLDFSDAKKQDLLTIYSGLTEAGYDQFHVLQFYLKMRKKSRLLRRHGCHLKDLPIFEVYSSVSAFRNQQNPEITLVLESEMPIELIFWLREEPEFKEREIKISITGSLDTVSLTSCPFSRINSDNVLSNQ